MKIQRDPALGAAIGPAATGPAAAAKPAGAARSAIGDEAASASARPAATVSVSSRARELHEALVAARASDDVRHNLVRQIKNQVDNGTYVVDPAAIAGGMLDRRA